MTSSSCHTSPWRSALAMMLQSSRCAHPQFVCKPQLLLSLLLSVECPPCSHHVCSALYGQHCHHVCHCYSIAAAVPGLPAAGGEGQCGGADRAAQQVAGGGGGAGQGGT